MPDILRLSLVFVLIVLLLRKKVKIGSVMLLGSAFLALLYLMPPALLARTAWEAATSAITLKLAAALSLIRVFELILRERNILAEMMQAARALFGNRKAVIVSMPLLIGMLPSVGGAYFSAPMVEESTRDIGMSAEEKGFINYWYRHPWEYVLPLYPGLLLASAISGRQLGSLILANLPYAALMAATGLLASMRQVGGRPGAARAAGRKVRGKALASFVPIAAVLLLVVAARVELYVSLLVVTAGLLLYYRYGARGALRALRHGFSLDVIVLIAGVMLFKGVMQSSGAVENLSRDFASWDMPLLPMLFLLPFVTGMLTGLTMGFVGSTFPLLVSLAGGGSLGAVSFAFASGFMGVLLSPVHVCLVLTKEYFKADLAGIYRRMFLPAAAVLCSAAAVYLLLGAS
jgi:integral membrane protein (TIGR00529 family)